MDPEYCVIKTKVKKKREQQYASWAVGSGRGHQSTSMWRNGDWALSPCLHITCVYMMTARSAEP